MVLLLLSAGFGVAGSFVPDVLGPRYEWTGVVGLGCLGAYWGLWLIALWRLTARDRAQPAWEDPWQVRFVLRVASLAYGILWLLLALSRGLTRRYVDVPILFVVGAYVALCIAFPLMCSKLGRRLQSDAICIHANVLAALAGPAAFLTMVPEGHGPSLSQQFCLPGPFGPLHLLRDGVRYLAFDRGSGDVMLGVTFVLAMVAMPLELLLVLWSRRRNRGPHLI